MTTVCHLLHGSRSSRAAQDPATIAWNLATTAFFKAGGKPWKLASVHPGVSVDDVVKNTGWELRVAANVSETRSPDDAELQAIREYDKEGFWTS